MASPVRTLTVNFVGKTDSLDKAFKRVNKGSALMSDKMARNMRMGIGAIGGLGAAVGGFLALTKPMVDAASDIGESLSKNTVLFGASADQVASWSETTARGFGISQREALEAVGVFGALTHAMGMSGAEGSDMSVTMVELAADMASFNNASPEETLIALQAGLRGEAEPLRRYGVLLDAATLKQRALSEGIITNTKKALTPQQKALAAYSEILAQTGVQQGDFERTSDGLANKQRILSAVWGDLTADMGKKLLPAFESVVKYLVDEFIPSMEIVFAMTGDEFADAMVTKIKTAISELQDPEWYAPLKDILVDIGTTLGVELGTSLWDGYVDTLSPGFLRDETGVSDVIGSAVETLKGLWDSLWGDDPLVVPAPVAADDFFGGVTGVFDSGGISGDAVTVDADTDDIFNVIADLENAADDFFGGADDFFGGVTGVFDSGGFSGDAVTVDSDVFGDAVIKAAEEIVEDLVPADDFFGGVTGVFGSGGFSGDAVTVDSDVFGDAVIKAAEEIVEDLVPTVTVDSDVFGDAVIKAAEEIVEDLVPTVTVDADPFVETVIKAAEEIVEDLVEHIGPLPGPTAAEVAAFDAMVRADEDLFRFFGGTPASLGMKDTVGGGFLGGSSGGFGGPMSRGGGTVGTIVINAPLVTGDAVITALHDAVENEGLTLPPRWSGSLGR